MTSTTVAVAPSQPEVGHTAELAMVLRGAIGSRWADGPDPLDAVCGYALGTPGKLFRPALLVESARVAGGDIGTVLPAAVGTECGHVASLIHDDIIDGDETRRGRAAVHAKFGLDAAIVAGDALIFDLFLCLAECRDRGATDTRIVAALEIAARSGIELCRGQALEADICERRIMDPDAYLRMISMKTAALFRAACQGGAVLVGACAEWVDALGAYGEHLGIAFQIQDDLLAYIGDGAAMGKPTGSDIKNGRLTLPVLLGYRDGTQVDRSVLDIALSAGLADDEALATVAEVLERTGAIAACSTLAAEHADAAQRALLVFPPSSSRDLLASFARRAVDRKG
jgi:geranylgeranyl diphosphate synthase type I